MSETQAGNIVGNRLRSTALIGATAALALFACSPARAEERRGTCEEPGETLAIYDCETGLVLWSRRPSEPVPPMVLSDRELCRLVVNPTRPPQDPGQCL